MVEGVRELSGVPYAEQTICINSERCYLSTGKDIPTQGNKPSTSCEDSSLGKEMILVKAECMKDCARDCLSPQEAIKVK